MHCIPCTIGSESFNQLIIPVDGMHPRCGRFCKGIKEPIATGQKLLSGFQESARKDIERAFGVLQAKFQAVARPVLLMEMELISDMVRCCLTLHNMCVSDRVMDGDVRARHGASHGVEPEEESDVECPSSVPAECKEMTKQLEKANVQRERPVIGTRNADPAVEKLLLQKERLTELSSPEEHERLHKAIMEQAATNEMHKKKGKRNS